MKGNNSNIRFIVLDKIHKDMISEEGWNMYMSPDQAARGLMLMQNYPEVVEDIPEDPPYRDLTEFELFKGVVS